MKKKTKVNETEKKLTVTYLFKADRKSRSIYHDEDFEAIEAEWDADNAELPTVGRTYMVATTYNNSNMRIGFYFEKDNGEGWPGNSDYTIKKYNGWRGTTDNVGFYGAGLRKCLEVKRYGKRSITIKIIFGKNQTDPED